MTIPTGSARGKTKKWEEIITLNGAQKDGVKGGHPGKAHDNPAQDGKKL